MRSRQIATVQPYLSHPSTTFSDSKDSLQFANAYLPALEGHFHLGGSCNSKKEATLGTCSNTEMPRVGDKLKSQVAAQPLLGLGGGWQASQGLAGRAQPGWRGSLVISGSLVLQTIQLLQNPNISPSHLGSTL